MGKRIKKKNISRNDKLIIILLSMIFCIFIYLALKTNNFVLSMSCLAILLACCIVIYFIGNK